MLDYHSRWVGCDLCNGTWLPAEANNYEVEVTEDDNSDEDNDNDV